MVRSGGQSAWVLLDLDGTVLDYDRAEQEAVLGTLAGVGLPASPLAHLGEVLIISDEVGAAKPAAAIFEAALSALGEPDPRAVTMVGDSLSADIAGGRAVGLPTVWVAPSQQPDPTDPALRPDRRIVAIGELPGLLRA